MRHDLVILVNKKNVGPGAVSRKLAKHFDCNRVTAGQRPNIKVRNDALIFNYGVSRYPVWLEDHSMLNHPESVAHSVNKLDTFQCLANYGVPTLDWTTNDLGWHDYETPVIRWKREGHKIYARNTVTGTRGQGITVIEPTCDYTPDAALYTKAFPTTHEFRVNVFNSAVIDYRQKKRMGKKKLEAKGIEKVNEEVRNLKGGWVFAKTDILHFEELKYAAVDAISAVGLDFGGVDMLAEVSPGGELLSYAVCEVNSAPSMDNHTREQYIKAIEGVLYL